jgi:hypothetical protein
MKYLLLVVALATSASAFAETLNCTFGEKELLLVLDANKSVLLAGVRNPDFSDIAFAAVDQANVSYDAKYNQATIKGEGPDINGSYQCR